MSKYATIILVCEPYSSHSPVGHTLQVSSMTKNKLNMKILMIDWVDQ